MSDLHANLTALHQVLFEISAPQILFKSQWYAGVFSYSGQISLPLLAVLSLLC